jgi:hypothetical protein
MKDCGVGSDSERERQNGNAREAWTPEKSAKRVTEIIHNENRKPKNE